MPPIGETGHGDTNKMNSKTSTYPCQEFDVIIVGGGPAGLTAALECAKAHAQTLLIDENSNLGGQYFRQRPSQMVRHYGVFRPKGRRLIERVREAGVSIALDTQVWGVFEDRCLELKTGFPGELWRTKAKAIIVATGALEKFIPFSGWTLPGVVSLGLALHMATIDHVAVGQRVLVAGSGPLIPLVASELLKIGVDVVEAIEACDVFQAALKSMFLLRYPDRFLETIQTLGTLARHKVPYRSSTMVVEARGKEKVEEVEVARLGEDGHIIPSSRRSMNVDALCIGFGFIPATEILRLLGCKGSRSSVDGCWYPSRTESLETSLPYVFAAGDVSRIGGAQVAMMEGRIAGIEAASKAGCNGSYSSVRRFLWKQKMRYLRGYSDTINSIFRLPEDLVKLIHDDVVVCRCEGVTAGDIRASVDFSGPDLGACRQLSRAGMGICQGRMCSFALERIIAQRAGIPIQELGEPTTRNPIKPIPVDVVVNSALDRKDS